MAETKLLWTGCGGGWGGGGLVSEGCSPCRVDSPNLARRRNQEPAPNAKAANQYTAAERGAAGPEGAGAL